VRADDGSLRGTLALMQLPDAFDDTLAPEALTTIVDNNGAIVARSDGASEWIGRRGNPSIVRLAKQGGQGIAQAKGVDGVMRQYGFTSIPEIGWYVYVGIPSSVVMEPVRQMLVRGVEGGAVIIVVVILIAVTLSRGIERPIKVLVGTAERRMLDDELKLKALSDRLLVVQEAERSRIARELHDDLGQSLTALKMDIIGLLANTEQKYGRSPIANRILRTLDSMVSSVQRISSELRPSILDDLGLVAALESEAMLFEERTGIECELSLPPDAHCEPHCATAIYRIVQEALTNVARHSNASRVEIRLRERTEELWLEIRDDGRGMTTDEIGDPHSLGLLGIRERADLVGGTVAFEGVSERGTIVSVRIPISSSARSTA
jgi:signal transduction histidine kinase